MQSGVSDHVSKTKEKSKEAKDAVPTAYLVDKNISKRKVRERLGVTSSNVSKVNCKSVIVIYKHNNPKPYVTASGALMRDSVSDFCHSE